MNVSTSFSPRPSKTRRKSAMATLRPPTFIARRNANSLRGDLRVATSLHARAQKNADCADHGSEEMQPHRRDGQSHGFEVRYFASAGVGRIRASLHGGDAGQQTEKQNNEREDLAGPLVLADRRAKKAADNPGQKANHHGERDPYRRDIVTVTLKRALRAEREIATGKGGEQEDEHRDVAHDDGKNGFQHGRSLLDPRKRVEIDRTVAA